MPVAEVFDGLCLALAGVLLLIPGYLSDVLALALILPPTRRLLARLLARRFVVVDGRAERGGGPGVIDVDYREVRDDEPPRRLP